MPRSTDLGAANTRRRVMIDFDLTAPSDGPIPEEQLAFFRNMLRQRVWLLVMDLWVQSGVTIPTIAKRLGLTESAVRRLMDAPEKWSLGTISDLAYAISGATLRISVIPINFPEDPSNDPA